MNPPVSQMGAITLETVGNAAAQLGFRAVVTDRYRGGSKWLVIFGVGMQERNLARNDQIRSGGRVAVWDFGYFNRSKEPRYSSRRVSINLNHPAPEMMERTRPDPSRWVELGIELRDDYRSDGHIVVVGLGPKSRVHLNLFDWEQRSLAAVRERFPDRRIVYRPKPGNEVGESFGFEVDSKSPIEDVLRGAALAVCRHSNVAADACVAGVPVECEDGAAFWLYRNGSNPGRAQRLDFLRRLAWWQWTPSEMKQAWTFLLDISTP